MPGTTSLFDAEPKISASDLQFFETKNPTNLVDNTLQVPSQGAEKSKGGLLLDTRDGARKGGNTAPAVIPGNVKKPADPGGPLQRQRSADAAHR